MSQKMNRAERIGWIALSLPIVLLGWAGIAISALLDWVSGTKAGNFVFERIERAWRLR